MADASFSEGRQADFDTGGGTDYIEISGITVPASGGAIVVGGSAETTLNVLGIGGGTVHDAVDSGNPIKIGGRAYSGAPAAVSAANDRTDAAFTLRGALHSFLVDSSGNALPTGGTQYAVDTALGATPTGTLALAIRDDTLSALTPVEGDAIGLRVDGQGSLWVTWPLNQGVTVVNSDFSSADAMDVLSSNATTPPSGLAVGNSVFNGTFWDRARSVTAVPVGANTDLGLPASAIGPGYSRIPADDTLASAVAGAALNVGGAGTVAIQVTGTWVGTITFQATYDDSTYFSVSARNAATTIWGTTTTANGNFAIPVHGYYRVRVNMTAFTSGSAVVRKIAHLSDGFKIVSGDVTHDAVDFGDPVKIGGHAYSGAPTAVSANNDRTDAAFTLRGAIHSYLVDSSGNPLSVGGTQYAEDAALGATPTGTVAIARRDDALATLTPVEDDAIAVKVNNRGALWVSIADGSGNQITSFGGGTQYVEDVALGAVGSATGTLVVGRASAAAPTAVNADADAVAAWLLRSGQQVVSIAAGTALIGGDATGGLHAQGAIAHDSPDSGNPVKIGGRAYSGAPAAVSAANDRTDAAFTLRGALHSHLVDSAGASITTGLQYVEDTAITANAGQGTLVIARRDDALSTLTPAEDKAIGLRVNSRGALWTTLDAGAPAALADALANPTTQLLGAANLAYNGSTWDRARALEGLATAAANPNIGIPAVSLADRRHSAVTVATTGSTVLSSNTSGSNHLMVRVGASTTGAFSFEVTADGTNWIAAKTFKLNGEVWVSGQAITPTSGDVFSVLTSGFQQVRATVSSTLGATVSMVPTIVTSPVVLSSQNTSAPPHSDGVTHLTETAQYTTTQTGTALVTPTAGRRLVVTYVQIGVGGTTAGTMQLWFGASGDTAYTRGTDEAIFDHEFAPSSTSKPGVIIGNGAGVVGIGGTDDILRVTDSAAINPLTVTVWYYETI